MKKDLRTIVCCALLQFGALFGFPMRPEEVQELMHSLNQPKVAQTSPEEQHQGDDPPDGPDRK